MNYEDMSDFEVNEQVARLRFGVFAACHDGSRKNGSVRASGAEFDPCNNPSDAWPIIISNKIGITHGSQMCSAVTVTDNELIQIPCTPSELLRAAMICFLKMKDAEK
jgi:hypothetical protein